MRQFRADGENGAARRLGNNSACSGKSRLRTLRRGPGLALLILAHCSVAAFQGRGGPPAAGDCLGPQEISLATQEHFKLEESSVSRLGSLEAGGAVLRAAFFSRSQTKEKTTFSVSHRPANPVEMTKGHLLVRFRISGWESIQYIAFGWMDQRKFWHVKSSNPLQGAWIEEPVDPASLAFGLTSRWEAPASIRIERVRVFVKGIPTQEGARIELDRYEAFQTEGEPGDFLFQVGDRRCSFSRFSSWWPQAQLQEPNQAALEALHQYEAKAFPSYLEDAKRMVGHGTLNMNGMPELSWNYREAVPRGVWKFTTTRFLWHALHPSRLLMRAYQQESDKRYLFLARELASQWLLQNYYDVSKDIRFAWYDHGTPERLVVLLELWRIGVGEGFDALFMSRLLEAIYRHGELLASEAFYARNQVTRYHNHAVFQDIALILVNEFVPQIVKSGAWQGRAVDRLRWQLGKLVSGEGVSTENSLGYHRGMRTLCEYTQTILSASGLGADWISRTCQGMRRFEKIVRYPDGRGPSFGDTFRRPNDEELARRARAQQLPQPGLHAFPQSGVAVVTDTVPGKSSWQLTFLATSLTKIHKHEDNLSLTLWMDGVEWLIDPGFYTHHYREPMAAYPRGAMAHNVVAVPERTYSIEPGSARLEVKEEEPEFEMLGTHRSYQGLLVKRSLRGTFGSGFIKIHDQIQGGLRPGEATTLNLQLGETVAAAIGEDEIRLSSPLSDKGVVIGLAAGTRCQAFSGLRDDENIAGWSYPAFAQAIPVTTIRCAIPDPESFQWHLESCTVPQAGNDNPGQ